MVVKIKKSLAIIAAVVMTLLFAVSMAVPAFAAEAVDTATDSNPQIVYDEPDLGEGSASDNYITLPDAPAKDGYIFKGWRVNGGGDLYSAGDVVVKDGNEEMHLQPVYEVATGAKADDSSASSSAEEPDLLNEYEDGSDIVLQYGHDNILTLPDAKEKEGYSFYGWSVNGDTTELYKSGSTIPIKAGEKLTLRPVYVSTEEANAVSDKYDIAAIACFVLFIVFAIIADVADSYEIRRAMVLLGILSAVALIFLPIVGLAKGDFIMQQALADTLQQLKYMTP